MLLQLKRAFLLAVFLFVVATANLDHPWLDRLWTGLAVLGLDISMTPVTVDMSLLSSSSDEAVYLRDLKLALLQSDQSEAISLDLRGLDLHKEKLPLLLMLEFFHSRSSYELYKRAFCRTMTRRFPKTTAFELIARPLHQNDPSIGLNRIYPCDEEGET